MLVNQWEVWKCNVAIPEPNIVEVHPSVVERDLVPTDVVVRFHVPKHVLICQDVSCVTMYTDCTAAIISINKLYTIRTHCMARTAQPTKIEVLAGLATCAAKYNLPWWARDRKSELRCRAGPGTGLQYRRYLRCVLRDRQGRRVIAWILWKVEC